MNQIYMQRSRTVDSYTNKKLDSILVAGDLVHNTLILEKLRQSLVPNIFCMTSKFNTLGNDYLTEVFEDIYSVNAVKGLIGSMDTKFLNHFDAVVIFLEKDITERQKYFKNITKNIVSLYNKGVIGDSTTILIVSDSYGIKEDFRRLKNDLSHLTPSALNLATHLRSKKLRGLKVRSLTFKTGMVAQTVLTNCICELFKSEFKILDYLIINQKIVNVSNSTINNKAHGITPVQLEQMI